MKVRIKMIDKKLMKSHFSINAVNYDRYARVQKRMAKEILDKIKTADLYKLEPNILDVGCGTGYLTNLLYNQFSSANILAVDIAEGMIEQASKKLKSKNIEFRCRDIEEMSIEEEYDLVTSNAVFQWFNNTDSTFLKLYNSLKPNGTMIISTFGNRTFSELNNSFIQAKKELKIQDTSAIGQKLYEMKDIKEKFENILNQNKMDFNIGIWENYEYEYFNSVREFIDSVKKIGANNSNREKSIKRPSVMKRMIDLYEENFKEDSGIKATYHCVYIRVNKLK